MIFVTVGTTDFPFERMDKVVIEISLEFPDEHIVYQSKSTKLSSGGNIKIYREFKYPKFIKYLKSANGIITHGGPATIFLALRECKFKPFILPREYKLAEHVSDHQVHYARFLAKKNLVKTVSTKKNITAQMISYILNPELNIFNSETPQLESLIDKLEQKIDNL